MINPRELRIGNLIRLSNEDICEVEEIKRNSVRIVTKGEQVKVMGRDLFPITITPNLLLSKCGFWTADNLDESDDYILKHVSFNVVFSRNAFSYHYLNLSHVKYLHQLQNLFFILTNKELEIVKDIGWQTGLAD